MYWGEAWPWSWLGVSGNRDWRQRKPAVQVHEPLQNPGTPTPALLTTPPFPSFVIIYGTLGLHGSSAATTSSPLASTISSLPVPVKWFLRFWWLQCTAVASVVLVRQLKRQPQERLVSVYATRQRVSVGGTMTWPFIWDEMGLGCCLVVRRR